MQNTLLSFSSSLPNPSGHWFLSVLRTKMPEQLSARGDRGTGMRCRASRREARVTLELVLLVSVGSCWKVLLLFCFI